MGSILKKGQHANPVSYTALQPLHCLMGFAQYGVNARDLIVGVMSMAEGTRGNPAPGARTVSASSGWLRRACSMPCRLMIKGLVRKLLQGFHQPVFGQIQVSGHQRKLCVIPESIRALALSLDPGFCCLLRPREVAAVEVE